MGFYICVASILLAAISQLLDLLLVGKSSDYGFWKSSVLEGKSLTRKGEVVKAPGKAPGKHKISPFLQAMKVPSSVLEGVDRLDRLDIGTLLSFSTLTSALWPHTVFWKVIPTVLSLGDMLELLRARTVPVLFWMCTVSCLSHCVSLTRLSITKHI